MKEKAKSRPPKMGFFQRKYLALKGEIWNAGYGNYPGGTFPVHSKFTINFAKRLIVEGGNRKRRWEEETKMIVDFLAKHYLNQRRNKNILALDYGGGIGRITLPLLEKYPYINVVLVDEAKDMLNLAKNYIPQAYFEKTRVKLCLPSEMKEVIKPNSLDLILAIYVFQHIFLEKLKPTLVQLHQLLKKDGRLLLVGALQNDDPQKRKIEIKKLLNQYFILEKERSPYQNQGDYYQWMEIAGYGNWQKGTEARERCQKMMGLFVKN